MRIRQGKGTFLLPPSSPPCTGTPWGRGSFLQARQVPRRVRLAPLQGLLRGQGTGDLAPPNECRFKLCGL